MSTLNIRTIDETERDYWDRNVKEMTNCHPLNAFGWSNIRKIDQWGPMYVVAEKDQKIYAALPLLEKRIPLTGLRIFYAPRGPVWDDNHPETLDMLMRYVRKIARKRHVIFLRIDPSIVETDLQRHDLLIKLGFIHLKHRWTFWNTPRDVYRIDLDKYQNYNDYFNKLHRDVRRCVRKAAKDGVRIETAKDRVDLDKFFSIFKDFSISKGFMSRGLDYQRKMWDEYIQKGNGKLFLAIYKDKIIGGLICIMFGNKCLAMHMGTMWEYRKLHTNYAYIAESIKWAKDNGCRWYSFRGVGTTPTQERFKRKFKPKATALLGYYDFVFLPLFYRIYKFMEFTALPAAFPILIKIRKLIYS